MKPSMIAELIETNAFELYGQPKWTFGKNTCNTYEVFAEKLHLPDGQTVSAAPVIEQIETDEQLTLQFSRWLLNASLSSVAEIIAQTDSHVTLSVNLLPRYAGEESFVDEVMAALEKHGVSPEKLQFELSEAQDLCPQGVSGLNRLHDEMGVGLYLANFGHGHSNVSLLSEVHFDGIELDRSYAARVPEHDQYCRLGVAIQHLAHTLDLKVCAKGIETQDQFEFFEELECFKGQGYLIGEPMPMDQLTDYIASHAVHIHR